MTDYKTLEILQKMEKETDNYICFNNIEMDEETPNSILLKIPALLYGIDQSNLSTPYMEYLNWKWVRFYF